MYFLHVSGVIVFQKVLIPSSKAYWFLGFTRSLRNRFKEPQTISMGFKSGLSGGVFHQFTPLSSKYSFASPLLCLGSLSCMNRCGVDGYLSNMNGISPASNIFKTFVAHNLPLNITKGVAPLDEIPPHK